MGSGLGMSADGSIKLDWGDELERPFRLAYGQLRELQEIINRTRVACGAPVIGPRGLLRALIEGNELAGDTREVMRLGLIGAGMKPVEAARLVKRYVDERPLAESAPTATLVLMAAVVGVPDDPVGKMLAGEAETQTGTTAPSPSPQSTASGPH